MPGMRIGKENSAKPETRKIPAAHDVQSVDEESLEILTLQKQVGNQAVHRLIQDGKINRKPAPVQRDNAIRGVKVQIEGQSPAAVQRVPEGQGQNAFIDALGWVGDLVRVIGWGALAGGEERGRAASHLLHNMLGSGEPVSVPKEWVMDSPDWQRAYERLLEDWVEHVVRDAATRERSGEREGFEHHVSTTSARSLPDQSCDFPVPMCAGSDQFLGSGAAEFRVGGNYMWRVTSDMLPVLEVTLTNIYGEYEDRYDWHHEDDPGQFSRQERGWYTPFRLHSRWDEPDRTERRLLTEGGEPGTFHAGPIEGLP